MKRWYFIILIGHVLEQQCCIFGAPMCSGIVAKGPHSGRLRYRWQLIKLATPCLEYRFFLAQLSRPCRIGCLCNVVGISYRILEQTAKNEVYTLVQSGVSMLALWIVLVTCFNTFSLHAPQQITFIWNNCMSANWANFQISLNSTHSNSDNHLVRHSTNATMENEWWLRV